jgi:hypothetical protein
MSVDTSKAIEFANIIYDYLIGLDETLLSPFLDDWPSKPFTTRIMSPNILPVLSYLPQLVAKTDTRTERIVRMLETWAKHLKLGQTYSKEDFGASFLNKYGWTELIGLRGPIKRPGDF